MKKFFLVFFILLDLAAMAGAAGVLYTYVVSKRQGVTPSYLSGLGFSLPTRASRTPAPSKPMPLPVSTTTSSAPSGAVTPASVPLTPTTPYRNIGFTYKNLKAKQVLIRADFTGWKGVPMKRDDHGIWSYAAQLTPGEYAYCFTVDDKIIKDPASKHTKRIAQTVVSAITVDKTPTKVSP